MKTQTLKQTLKAEITAIENISKIINSDFENTLELVEKRTGKIVTIGIGKSSFVAGKLAATLTSLGNPSIALHPSDALHGDSGIVENGDAVFAFSFSGESVEVVKLCKYLKSHFDIVLVSIIGNKKSSLAKISDKILEIKVEKEGCPMNCAPMASVTASLVVADLIASGLIKDNFSKESFSKYHPGGKLGLTFKMVKDLMTEAPIIEIGKNKIGTLFEAVEKINKYKKGIVGIVQTISKSNKKLIGVLTDGDIRRLFGKDGNDSVEKYMSDNPKTIDQEENLLTALKIMEDNKITSLFVLENKTKNSKEKTIVGIIHIHNIIEQYVA